MTFIRTTAIAWLTIQDAIRSRLLVSLASILVIGLIGLPLLIIGDNTLAGQVQVILNYTLTFALTILSVVTLWAACGGLSSEIQDRRLYLVVTKPVHRYELWLGKWLGIVGLNGVLLLMTGIIVSLMIWHTLRASTEPVMTQHQVREQFLVAHQSLFPVSPDWVSQAKLETDRLMESGRAPAGITAAMIQAELMKEMKAARFVVAPNRTVILAYQLPSNTTNGNDLILKYKFESTRPEKSPVPAEWTVGGLTLGVTNYPGIPNTLIIPASVWQGTNLLTLKYHRLDTNNPATLMLAQDEKGPELLVPSGDWLMNLAKGLTMMLCRLAFLAALGLTAGSLLSMPVAVFVVFFVMILLASSGYVESVATSGVFYVPHEGPALEQTMLDIAILHLFRIFNGMTQPLLRLNPIPLIAEGRMISWTLVGHAVGLLAGFYTAVTAFVGISLFNRRELG